MKSRYVSKTLKQTINEIKKFSHIFYLLIFKITSELYELTCLSRIIKNRTASEEKEVIFTIVLKFKNRRGRKKVFEDDTQLGQTSKTRQKIN